MRMEMDGLLRSGNDASPSVDQLRRIDAVVRRNRERLSASELFTERAPCAHKNRYIIACRESYDAAQIQKYTNAQKQIQYGSMGSHLLSEKRP